MNYQTVLDFWFSAETQPYWFAKSDAFDQQLRNQFLDTLEQARQAELWSWRENAEGRLAEIIVLDQFSRNLYRDRPASFAQDPMALALAQETIQLGLDQNLRPEQCSFLYMPFMHSESKIIHEQALKLFEDLGNPINLDFEKKHKIIIDRFGRYPHRNEILGRESTVEEIEFLTQPNSSF
ncbi:DUF924 family protein [Acinetobacter sp. WCHAc060025]|uniref:DUF924 family protein n=1 Tax=Acinetobacter sp. WCHAc060025 TaxID=2518625 RepID=UPI001022D7D4|nr:DUF924 family protein [Acinetobacter sp. WCHAc060025]RZG76497.1 DUF924 domain-containing protein [Acinetobacter sp. WCHAc060025]